MSDRKNPLKLETSGQKICPPTLDSRFGSTTLTTMTSFIWHASNAGLPRIKKAPVLQGLLSSQK
ncbi:MAG: hypothetical protein ACYC3B_00540 [Sedimentisphaerales bacterium]